MKTELLPIKSIQGNPKNPRIIKDDKFKKLVKSLQNFPKMGDIRPVVCNADMVILGGNMRWKAAIEAGWKEIPVTVVDWSEDRQQEFIIKDMELDPKYCQVIIDRMKKLDSDIVIKKNGVEI